MAEIQINTTQNVKIAFTAANVSERIAAFLIDMGIKWGYYIVLGFLMDGMDEMDQWSEIGLISLLSLPVVFYSLVLEIFLNGQTLGKKALKIKVVKIDGYQASVADYAIRWFFRVIDVYLFFIGFFFMAFSKNSQRIGDMAAGTSVISIRNKVTIDHTILENLQEGYKPTFPNVIRLSDNDARIIKETFHQAKAAKDYKTLIKLRSKIMEVTDIKDRNTTNDIDFIQTILKDYNYYTQSM